MKEEYIKNKDKINQRRKELKNYVAYVMLN
jgi:hypothetical protein